MKLLIYVITFKNPKWQQIAADMLDKIAIEYNWDEHGRMRASEDALMLLDEAYISYDIISWN